MPRAPDLSTQAGKEIYTRLETIAKKGLVTTYDLLKGIATFLVSSNDTNGKRIGEIALDYLEKQSSKLESTPVSEETKQQLGNMCIKYKIACSFEKDTTKDPPEYSVFFQGKDAKILEKALAEVAKNILTKEKEKDRNGNNKNKSIKNIMERLEEKDKQAKNKVQNKERNNSKGAR